MTDDILQTAVRGACPEGKCRYPECCNITRASLHCIELESRNKRSFTALRDAGFRIVPKDAVCEWYREAMLAAAEEPNDSP